MASVIEAPKTIMFYDDIFVLLWFFFLIDGLIKKEIVSLWKEKKKDPIICWISFVWYPIQFSGMLCCRFHQSTKKRCHLSEVRRIVNQEP
mmetsp:Transcript_45319/g.94323  ORF Transcript_45319/g.94323 Transcript_45319/m.94323 type:complete len:90 (-) Transcript_45319:133-402(-)